MGEVGRVEGVGGSIGLPVVLVGGVAHKEGVGLEAGDTGYFEGWELDLVGCQVDQGHRSLG